MSTQTVSGFQLSPQQKRLWRLSQDNSVYLTQAVIRLEGNRNLGRLKAALQQVIERHEILRTSFHNLPGVKFPVMVVEDDCTPLWEVLDWQSLDPQSQWMNLTELLQQIRDENNLLQRNCLFQPTLIKLSANQHLLLLNLSVLIADSKTAQNIVQELQEAYRLGSNAIDLSAEDIIQYCQFSEWQNQLFSEEDAELAQAFWQKRKLTSLTKLRLPLELNDSEQAAFTPNVQNIAIAPDTLTGLKALAKRLETSVEVVLLASWQTLIWRLTQQSNIVIGYQCDRREEGELAPVMGLLATWIPIEVQLTADLRFSEAIAAMNRELVNASEWQDYFVPEAVMATSPLAFPLGFEYERFSAPSMTEEDLSFVIDRQYSFIEPFKVKLAVTEVNETLELAFHYDVNCFSADAIEGLVGQFQTFVTHGLHHPEATINELEVLSQRDRQHLLVELNQTQVDYPQRNCIHHLFEAQVLAHPERVAVVYEEQQLTFAELNEQANQLAHYLQRQGVKPEAVVGLYLERSLDAIVALLGILKAGGAYLPLDPLLPQDNLMFRLQEAQANWIVSHSALATPERSVHFSELTQWIDLDANAAEIAKQPTANPVSGVTPENLVYVLFTSGSTGKPKGVAVEHRQLVNYQYAIAERLDLPPAANYATVSTLAADLGNTVVFPALCNGGCLHILSTQRVANPKALAAYCEQHPIDCLKIVPSHLAALLAAAPSSALLPRQRLILGGEAASWEFVSQIQPQIPDCVIFNHYGPTETTVGALTYRLNPQALAFVKPNNSTTVPLGRPLANTHIYVLDSQQRPVPMGVTGEIFIGGAGVARGYVNRPELTAAKFIPNPFQPTERLYQTGDLGRYLPDGNLEFLGRCDRQVKVRGFRIELEEIETVLGQSPQLQQAVVLLRNDEPDNPRLVAYAVPQREQTPKVSDLRRFLREKLPEYMIPAAFVLLKTLPLTTNGKVDYPALPTPEKVRSEEVAYVAPRTDIERAIAQIWQELLSMKKVGVDDNFFDLGGHSLLLVQVHSKLQQQFSQEITITDLFEYPTINALANYLNQQAPTTNILATSQERAESRKSSRQRRAKARQHR